MVFTKIKNACQALNVTILPPHPAIATPSLDFIFLTEKHGIAENLAKMLRIKDF